MAPSVEHQARTAKLARVLHTAAELQVRSPTEDREIKVEHGPQCYKACMQPNITNHVQPYCRCVSQLILMLCKPSPYAACKLVAAGVYNLDVLLQEAVDILVGASVPAYSCRVFEAWPNSRLSLCWPVLVCRSTAPYTVHEMPHIVWRRTLSFDDESDAPRGSWSGLADAALALLRNSALDGAAKLPQQQQQQQVSGCPMVPSRQCNMCSSSAGGNWEAFVQQCLRSKPTAAVAAELSGHAQQMGEHVDQQEGEWLSHSQQQGADASSSVKCPLQCQVRLKSEPDPEQSSHSMCM